MKKITELPYDHSLVRILGIAGIAIFTAAPAMAQTPTALYRGSISDSVYSKCVDNRYGESNENNPVILYGCNNSDAQRWTYFSDATLRIAGKCLTPYANRTTPETRLVIATCTGLASQSWDVTSSGKIVHALSGLCMDNWANRSEDYNQIQIYPCHSGGNQKWKLSGVVSTDPADDLGIVSSSKLTARDQEVENGGLPLSLTNGLLTAGVKSGYGSWRSESAWGLNAGHYLRLPKGTRVVAEFDVKLNLGNLDSSAGNVLYQLHGPIQYRGTWPGPPVTVVVENNEFRIAGGYAVPTGGTNADGSPAYTSKNGYTLKSGIAASNGAWHRIKISTLLGGPGAGTVDAWVDGNKIANGYKPAAGTYYSVPGFSHEWLYVKNGLYGWMSNPTPGPQNGQFSNLRLTLHDSSGITTYYAR